MNLDLFVIISLCIAIFKGWQRGLLLGLVSTLGMVVGVLVAFKFTTVVITQPWMEPYRDTPWMSMAVFALLVMLTMIIANIIARLIQKSMELAMMGWINRLGGVILFCLMSLFTLSCFVMIAGKVSPKWEESMKDSKSYALIQPIAPMVIDGVGSIWPWIKDAVDDLDHYFEPKPPIIPGQPA